jgi:hypothetical protein
MTFNYILWSIIFHFTNSMSMLSKGGKRQETIEKHPSIKFIHSCTVILERKRVLERERASRSQVMRIKSRSSPGNHTRTLKKNVAIRCFFLMYHWRGTFLIMCVFIMIMFPSSNNIAPTSFEFPEHLEERFSKNQAGDDAELNNKRFFFSTGSNNRINN